MNLITSIEEDTLNKIIEIILEYFPYAKQIVLPWFAFSEHSLVNEEIPVYVIEETGQMDINELNERIEIKKECQKKYVGIFKLFYSTAENAEFNEDLEGATIIYDKYNKL